MTLTLRGDAMILTHGGPGSDRVIAAAILFDALRGGHLEIVGQRIVAGPEPADSPLLAALRARPAAPLDRWLDDTAAWAPERVAAELVGAGLAVPLSGPFRLSIPGRVERAARARLEPELAALLDPHPVNQAMRSSAMASNTWTYASTAASSWVTESVHSSSRPGVMKMPRFML